MNNGTNKMESPFVSVIIVDYNYAHLLPRTLNALKAQTFKDFEIVIVNNGSKDNSEEVIDQFIEANPELSCRKVEIKNNKGVHLGRNSGLDAATGKYVLFNDADDWMDENCLEVLAGLAKQTDADKVFGVYREVDTEGKELRVCTYADDQSKWFAVALQATLFKRSVIVENNIRFHESWLDDIDFNTFFNYYARSIAHTNVPTYNYYVNQFSTSGAKVKKRGWTYMDLIRDMLRLFTPLLSGLEGKDKEDLNYILIKQYYFFTLHDNRYSSMKEIRMFHKQAHGLMLEYLPDYMKFKGVKLFSRNGDRPTGRFLTWLFFTAEKCHMINVLFFLFITMSKVTYLNP